MASFRFGEKPTSGGASGKEPTRELLYYAVGSTDPSFVMSWALQATPSMLAVPQGTLYRQDVLLDWESASYCNVRVPYGKNDNSTGSFKKDFDTTGGTVHITASKETVGKFPDTAPDHKQLIGVHGNDVDGADIIIPMLRINCAYRHPAAVISMAQIKNLARNTGKVNSHPFLTFAAGEVLFLGARGADGTDTEAEINYSFAMSENADGLSIGEIANIVKKGHNLAWIAYKDVVDGGKPVKQPAAVYIERVYDEIDLRVLLGFGG